MPCQSKVYFPRLAVPLALSLSLIVDLAFALAVLLVMTLLYLRLGAGERWVISFALSLGAFVFVYGLFERGLGVPFPAGRLLVWLGYG